ncbi:hypothetical protein TCAL_14940 [Tigriopus californicus]|uniref:Transcription initiation factor TFIID subunit 8 n=1 Tax=Tigriopus californicus TaxID=6832 RepID=A0A553N6R4_TIGCA|nr:transcription initiation factor TFIID subunit 8-like [Tigriopus californicus]TRY61135.1 hypothetical protein TCAL_14940 [Tigriopus californicus]
MILSASGISNSSNSLPDPSVTEDSYRKCLKMGVANILSEVGFDSTTPLALETLCELFQSFLGELGRSSRAYTELACRAHPLHADVLLALIEMGVPTEGLSAYAFRPGRKSLANPQPAPPIKQTSILHTGDRPASSRSKARQAGGDFLPELPDSHAFVRTPTHKQPVTDYVGVREKAASQKRDVERALTRFIAKTGQTHSLFSTNDTNLFPLISPERLMPDQPLLPAYINALLFKDQVFEEDEREFQPKKKKEDDPLDDSDDDDPPPPVPTTEKMKSSDPIDSDSDEEVKVEPPPSAAVVPVQESPVKRNRREHDGVIENPFLKPVRMPRTTATPVKRAL